MRDARAALAPARMRATQAETLGLRQSIIPWLKEARMTLPDIALTRRDLGRLDTLLGSEVLARIGKVGAFLLDEITRARILADRESPPTLVTMGAIVRFRDDDSGRTLVARLVYPREVMADQHHVSVLTPVGAALLGLSEGQSIDYETIDGRLKTLTVLKVVGSASEHPSPSIATPASRYQLSSTDPGHRHVT
jgi:regulator of nucleoside diphosphate kinase